MKPSGIALPAPLLLLAIGTFIALMIDFAKGAALHGIPALEFGFWLTAGGGVVLFVAAKLRGLALPPTRRNLVYFALTGLLGLAAPNILSFTIARHAGASYGTVPLALSPLVTYVLAMALRLDRPEGRRIAGLAVGLVGTGLVFFDLVLATGDAAPIWLLAALGIPLFTATGNVLRSLLWPEGVADLALGAGLLLGGAVWLVPVMIVAPPVAFTNGFGTGEALVLGQIACTSMMYALFFTLQRIAGPVYLSQIGYVAAGMSVVLGFVFFREVPQPAMLAGLPLIVIGVLMVRPRGDLREA